MHCTNCGAQLEADGKFCRSCGHPVRPEEPEAATEVIEEWPASTAVLPVALPPPASPGPPLVPAPTVPPTAGRPGWLIPAIIAAVVLLLIAVAGGVLLVLNSSPAKESFAEQAAPVIAPVVKADTALSVRVGGVQKPADLAAVSRAAGADAIVITTAQGGVAVLSSGKNAAAADSLKSALAADLAYANATKAAADGLTPGLATAAATAGQQAGQAYQTAAATTTPPVSVPAARLYLTAQQLATLATQKQAATQQALAASGAIRSYVRSIDSLLRNSSDTRSNLGTLIGQVQSNQIDGAQATAAISSIINQRQDLQNQASAVQAPALFRTAADSLRQSITAALQDDYAIQSWINAWYQNDQYAFDQAYNQHLAATAQASSAKASFITLYNSLRRHYLHLAPLDATY